MNSFKVCLFLIFANSLRAGWGIKDFIQPIKDYTEHMKQHGEGQNALREAPFKNSVILGQTETIKIMAEGQKEAAAGLEKNAQATTNGAHQVTEAVDKSTAAQVEINKTLQNINAGAQVIGGAVGAIYIAKTAKEAYDFINPDPKKRAQDEAETEAAITRSKILKTRKQLSSCFALHRKESRDENGLPYSCNEAYHAFAAATDYENAEHIAQAFRHANPIHNSQS